MSVSPAVRAASSTPRLDVSRTLKPVIRSIGIARVARGLVLGFTLGALVGTGVLVAGHIYAFAAAHPIALTCLILGALAGVVWGIVRWPREAEAARTADLFFALDDRLTTAVELRGSDAPVAVVQSRDTAKRIEGLPLGRSRGTVLRRREMLLAAAATLAFAGSLVLGPRAETRPRRSPPGRSGSRPRKRYRSSSLRCVSASRGASSRHWPCARSTSL
jgi:hypothetical protein